MVRRSASLMFLLLAIATPARAQSPCLSATSPGVDYGSTTTALDFTATAPGWRLWAAIAPSHVPVDLHFDLDTPAERRVTLDRAPVVLDGTAQRVHAAAFRTFTLYACPPDEIPAGAGFLTLLPLVQD